MVTKLQAMQFPEPSRPLGAAHTPLRVGRHLPGNCHDEQRLFRSWKRVHPYPRSRTTPPYKRFAWPKTAGIRATRRVAARQAAQAFLQAKWRRELEYRLIKELWAFEGHRIAVRFAYEWHDDSKNWYRSYGNENWEFNESGLMTHRHASINDLPIAESDRTFHWPIGRRPDDHPGLGVLGL